MSSVIWRNIIINIPLIVCHVGRVLPPSLCFWLSCLLACLLDCLLQLLDQLIIFIFYCLISCLSFWLIDWFCLIVRFPQHWANASCLPTCLMSLYLYDLHPLEVVDRVSETQLQADENGCLHTFLLVCFISWLFSCLLACYFAFLVCFVARLFVC